MEGELEIGSAVRNKSIEKYVQSSEKFDTLSIPPHKIKGNVMNRIHYSVLLPMILFFTSAASAVQVVLNSGDGLISTVETLNDDLTAPTAPALPADGSFTVPYNGSLSTGQGRFFRYNINLPPDYSNLSFNLALGVNDEFAIYLNDSLVAVQDDTSVSNFNSPFPGFVLNSNNTSSDTSGGKLDFLSIDQSDFQVGNNELTIYAVDTVAGGSIFNFNISVEYDVPGTPDSSTPVPALSTLGLLMMVGTLGVCGYLNRKRRKSS